MKPHSMWPIKGVRERPSESYAGVPEKERKPGHGQADGGFGRY